MNKFIALQAHMFFGFLRYTLPRANTKTRFSVLYCRFSPLLHAHMILLAVTHASNVSGFRRSSISKPQLTRLRYCNLPSYKP